MTGSSYPPTYDGVGADAYLEWEIALDNIFATRCMCPRRKVKNAASVLRLPGSTPACAVKALDDSPSTTSTCD